MIIKFNKKYLLIIGMLMSTLMFSDKPRLCFIFQIIFSGMFIIKYVNKDKIQISKFNLKLYLPYIAFLLFGLASTFWAFKPSYTISIFYKLFRLYGVTFLLCLSIKNFEDVNEQLRAMMVIIISTIIYLFVKTPFYEWKDMIYGSYIASTDEGRIGSAIGYHPNTFGTLCFIFILICLYWYYIKKKKIYLLPTAILLVVALFTKSRASLAMIAISMALFYLLVEQRKYKKVIKILGVIVFAIIIYWAIFNIPILYKLIGFRFEGILGFSGQKDASTVGRTGLLINALEIFREYPIGGVGLDNFKYYSYVYQSAFKEVYAHSNWGELLADTGIIGTSLYYIPQVYAVWVLWRKLNKLNGDDRVLCALFLTILSVMIVFDIQKMSYCYFHSFYMIILSITVANLFRMQKNFIHK